MASAARRRARSSCNAPVPVSTCRSSSLMMRPRTRLADPAPQVATLPSNAAAVPVGTGSGIDQCNQVGGGWISSWARSQTVMTSAGRVVTSSSNRGTASDRSTRARRAAATAPGCTRRAGWVPALIAGAPASARQRAAASWLRAEFAVQMNSAARTVGWSGARSDVNASGTSETYRRRPSPLERCRVTRPAAARTSRWCARRFEGQPNRACSSAGERSDEPSSSTIASRCGSPRATCRAARPARSLLHTARVSTNNY